MTPSTFDYPPVVEAIQALRANGFDVVKVSLYQQHEKRSTRVMLGFDVTDRQIREYNTPKIEDVEIISEEPSTLCRYPRPEIVATVQQPELHAKRKAKRATKNGDPITVDSMLKNFGDDMRRKHSQMSEDIAADFRRSYLRGQIYIPPDMDWFS